MIYNKKVLLRERKRHTAEGVPTLAGGRGNLPWGTPRPDLARGVPTLARGVPTLGYPPILTWLGGTYLGWGVPTLGYPPILTWLEGTYLGQVGYLPGQGRYPPSPSGLGRGTPRRCEQTENIIFPRPSDAVGSKLLSVCRMRWNL